MNYLKQYREEKGFTQEMVAAQVNIPIRTYQYYEADGREPKVRLAHRIAAFLGTSVDAIWPDCNQSG